MRNDKERKEFVEDERNWQIVDGTNNLQVQIKRLVYHDMQWFKIEALRMVERYDIRKRETTKEPKWCQIGMYDDHITGVLGEHVSVTQIVNRIKDYDREHKERK